MKAIIAVIAFILVLGIVGNDDYADAKLAEQYFCKHHPKPAWCRQ